MILTIKKKFGTPLIIDTNKMTGFKESGQGYDIAFGDDVYYFSLEDATYLINQVFSGNTENKI